MQWRTTTPKILQSLKCPEMLPVCNPGLTGIQKGSEHTEPLYIQLDRDLNATLALNPLLKQSKGSSCFLNPEINFNIKRLVLRLCTPKINKVIDNLDTLIIHKDNRFQKALVRSRLMHNLFTLMVTPESVQDPEKQSIRFCISFCAWVTKSQSSAYSPSHAIATDTFGPAFRHLILNMLLDVLWWM